MDEETLVETYDGVLFRMDNVDVGLWTSLNGKVGGWMWSSVWQTPKKNQQISCTNAMSSLKTHKQTYFYQVALLKGEYIGLLKVDLEWPIQKGIVRVVINKQNRQVTLKV